MLRHQVFPAAPSHHPKKLACMVAGFAGKISHFKKPITVLTAAGYDVIAFEYENHILDEGRPEHLRRVIDDVTGQVRAMLPDYDEVICTGASLGAYIAVNVQRRISGIKLGIYGTAGVKVSHVIYHSPVFRKIKGMYVRNGYDEAALAAAWQDIDDTAPGLADGQSLVIVLGRSDRIIRHADAVNLMDDWKNQGVDVTYFSKRGRGHSGTILWYRKHFAELLELANAKAA